MQRQRSELVPIGDALSGTGGAVKALQPSPQARHHFTVADQVNQLVTASEADPDLGFMARMMALCSLPRTNPGNRHQYKRTNGPYKLVMVAGADNKLPFGNLPRLLIAWLCTEAVRTQNPEIVLGPSLSEFMRKLGIHTQSGGRGGMRTLMVLVQTAKGIGDNGIWRIAKLNGILYLPDVGSKTTSFFSAFAGISASN